MIEQLSSAEFLTLWSDPGYCAKRRSEAELQKRFCASCSEGSCECGEVDRLAAEFASAPEVWL